MTNKVPKGILRLNRAWPLYNKLRAAWVVGSGPGGVSQLFDLYPGGQTLQAFQGPVKELVSEADGFGLNLGADGSACQATASSRLRLGFPMTLAMGVIRRDNMENNATLFAVLENDSGASPFTSYSVAHSGNTGDFSEISMLVNHGGTARFHVTDSMITTLILDKHHNIVAVFANQDQRLYRDGAEIANASFSYTGGNPQYQSTALVTFGDGTFADTRDSNCTLTYGLIFSGALTSKEAVALSDPATAWEWLEQPRFPTYFFDTTLPAAGGGNPLASSLMMTGVGF